MVNRWNGRIVWLKATVSAGMAAGFLLSPRLWFGTRLYPATPVWQFLKPLNPPFDFALFVTLLALLAWIALAARPAKSVAVFFVLAAVYAMFDQQRWQPWFYQYLFMLAALAWRDSAMDSCRLIVASIYFWSGVQKANPGFVHDAFPYMLEPLTKHLPEAAGHWLGLLAYGAPAVEVAIAIGLVTQKFRKPAVIAALAMHGLILASIGPLGHNYNTVVWPWNLAMGAFAWLLFWPDGRAQASQAARAWIRLCTDKAPALLGLFLVLFGIVPLLSFLNLWDGYLSFSLYSGNYNDGTIYMADSVADQLPEEMQEYIYENESKVDELEIDDWSFGELNVPAYAELRVFQNIGKRVCAWAGNPSEIVLVVQGKSTWIRRRRQSVYTCATLSK